LLKIIQERTIYRVENLEFNVFLGGFSNGETVMIDTHVTSFQNKIEKEGQNIYLTFISIVGVRNYGLLRDQQVQTVGLFFCSEL